ncbi:MAG: ATP synthase F1 subunit epsilon [Bacteroidota bacterium]
MNLEIITPDKKIFSGEVKSVTVPGAQGTFQVLNNHAPIVSTLMKGTMKYVTTEGETKIPVKSGVIEVLKNKIIVLLEA